MENFLTTNRRQADVVDIFEVGRGADPWALCLRSKSLWPGSESLISRPRQKCLKDLISSAGLALCVALRGLRLSRRSGRSAIGQRPTTDRHSRSPCGLVGTFTLLFLPCIYSKL